MKGNSRQEKNTGKLIQGGFNTKSGKIKAYIKILSEVTNVGLVILMQYYTWKFSFQDNGNPEKGM